MNKWIFFNLNSIPHIEALADRIRHQLTHRRVRFTGKKMFGGICFLVDNKKLHGVEKDRLMARIDPDDEAAAMKK